MKTTRSFPRAAFMALALGTASASAAFAQSTTTPSTTTPAPNCSAGLKQNHDPILTSDEKAQLKKAHDAALASNGTLQTEQASLKQQFEALKAAGKSDTTRAQWQAFRAQASDFHQKMRTAELLIDPTLAPVFAKLDAAPHKHWHHSV